MKITTLALLSIQPFKQSKIPLSSFFPCLPFSSLLRMNVFHLGPANSSMNSFILLTCSSTMNLCTLEARIYVWCCTSCNVHMGSETKECNCWMQRTPHTHSLLWLSQFLVEILCHLLWWANQGWWPREREMGVTWNGVSGVIREGGNGEKKMDVSRWQQTTLQ